MVSLNREIKFDRPHLSIEHSRKYEMNLPISIHDVKTNPIAQTSIGTEDRELAGKGLNLELYSSGFIDGLTGLDAQLPHFKDYWDGYCIGYREYCCRLLGEEIPPEEIPASAVEALIN